MVDSACACSATNTLQNEIDEVQIVVSDLQNLAYMQQLVLSERVKNSCERDALLTLHHALCVYSLNLSVAARDHQGPGLRLSRFSAQIN
ncbi:hypothetical protein PsAD37_02952 [Pseudovibrio sp. Ad37]|nr:hypothetical protein PsAD37_02952 [Pseudovibrio sp. Ad37]